MVSRVKFNIQELHITWDYTVHITQGYMVRRVKFNGVNYMLHGAKTGAQGYRVHGIKIINNENTRLFK